MKPRMRIIDLIEVIYKGVSINWLFLISISMFNQANTVPVTEMTQRQLNKYNLKRVNDGKDLLSAALCNSITLKRPEHYDQSFEKVMKQINQEDIELMKK
jgi:hypothetical protein